jgi:hypothetical protein
MHPHAHRRLCPRALALAALVTGCSGLAQTGPSADEEARQAWAGARNPPRGPAATTPSAGGGELPRWGERARFAASAKRSEVHGIAGSLSSYDVQRALAERAEAMASCGTAGGTLRFRIRVRSDGSVANVALPEAKSRQRGTERCLVDVLSSTRFPRPHGGEAEVAYTLAGSRAPRAR